MRLEGTSLLLGFAVALFSACSDDEGPEPPTAGVGGGGQSGSAGKGGKGGTGGTLGGKGGSGGTAGRTGGASGTAGRTAGAAGGGGSPDGEAGAAGGGGIPDGEAGAGGSGGNPDGEAGAGGGGGNPDGEAGAGGSDPDGSAVVAADTNLTTTPLTSGRTCAQAPQFAVLALSASSATLASSPASDCLVAGDEVLLINLQGTPSASGNVGNWELLTVSSLNGSELTFATPKTRNYGDPGNSDLAIGAGATDQKVAIVRVPHFAELNVSAGATLDAAPWDGATGGVVALRASSLTVAGTISAARLGYRPGRFSRDDESCSDSVATEAGESISGPPIATTLRNTGGPGGLGVITSVSFAGNSPVSASAGHALAGELGSNPNGYTLGEPGAAYGVGDASRLTMGSGASGGITCENGFAGPALIPEFSEGHAGGIVLLLVESLNVAATGSITATPPDAVRDVSASGGYVFIRGTSLAVETARVTARGATGRSVNVTPPLDFSNHASPGYIVLQTPNPVSGTTDPVANVIP